MERKSIENKGDEFDNLIFNLKNQNHALLKEMDLLKKFIIRNNITNKSDENYCPICENFSNFKSFGITSRSNALCPHCHSLERHRLVYFIIQRRYGYLLEHENIKLLHFAPEIPFYNLFKKFNNIDYYPVDFNPELYEARNIHIRDKVDMENLFQYEDNMFDFIYHCHVLEHIPNDLNAMGELYRVLKNGGVCITLAPVFNIPKTIENSEYNTPELRLKYYGQEDHLRKYGLDFKDRLESVGFNVEEIKSYDFMPSQIENKFYGIRPDRVFICTK